MKSVEKRRLTVQRTSTSRWLRYAIGSVIALIIVWPICHRIYRLLTPLDTRATYEAALSDLASRNLGETQVAIELLSTVGSGPQYQLVLEGGIDMHSGRLQQAIERLIPALEDPATSAIAHALTGEAKKRLELAKQISEPEHRGQGRKE